MLSFPRGKKSEGSLLKCQGSLRQTEPERVELLKPRLSQQTVLTNNNCEILHGILFTDSWLKAWVLAEHGSDVFPGHSQEAEAGGLL